MHKKSILTVCLQINDTKKLITHWLTPNQKGDNIYYNINLLDIYLK